MKSRYLYALLLVLAMGVAACASVTSSSKPMPPENANQEAAKPMPGEPEAFVMAQPEPLTNYMNCYVKVWEGENFSGESLILRPDDMNSSQFEGLRSGADNSAPEWSKNIGSIEVGECASAEVMSDSEPLAAPVTLQPGFTSAHAQRSNLSRIGSMKLYCTCRN